MLRRTTPTGRLARMGFADARRAQVLVTEDLALDPDGADAGLLEALAAAADPDLALAALARMAFGADLRGALRADAGLRTRLTAVLGASAALGDHLARHPDDWRVLCGDDALRSPSAAELRAALLAATGAGKPAAAEAAIRHHLEAATTWLVDHAKPGYATNGYAAGLLRSTTSSDRG